MWYEDRHELHVENIKIEKEKFKINEFEKIYKGLVFNDLIKQKPNICTDDMCCYYKHRLYGNFYAWNYYKNEWKEVTLNLHLYSELFD